MYAWVDDEVVNLNKRAAQAVQAAHEALREYGPVGEDVKMRDVAVLAASILNGRP
jgi:hypothetical protein